MVYQRVLVAVNGSEGDEHALRAALAATRRSRATVFVIFVVEVPQALALETELPEEVERGERALQRCEQVAQQERQSVEAELLQSRHAGTTIVDEALQREADLVVLSVAGRERRGEFSLGRTVPYVLKHAACEVWALRRPLARS